MKIIILSLTVVMAFLISPAIAQKANGYNANAGANVADHNNKGNVIINVLATDPVKDVFISYDPKCPCVVHIPWIAKYISPMGNLYKVSNATGNTVVSNSTQVQKKK